MENLCWNIREIKKTGQGLSEELGKYIWLAKADTSQEAPASKSGSSSLVTGIVTFMSVFGLLMRPELPENIVSAYFTAWGMNFIAALPLQLLLVGPISRLKLQMWQRYFDNRA